jgi:hypothetical protein
MRIFRILIVITLVTSLVLVAFQTASAESAGCKTINDNHRAWAPFPFDDLDQIIPLGEGLRFAQHDRLILNWQITFVRNRPISRSEGTLSMDVEGIAPRTGFTAQNTGSSTFDVTEEAAAQAIALSMRLKVRWPETVVRIQYQVLCETGGAIASSTPIFTHTPSRTPTPTIIPTLDPFLLVTPSQRRVDPYLDGDNGEFSDDAPLNSIETTLTPDWEPTLPPVEQSIEPTEPPPVEPTFAPPVDAPIESTQPLLVQPTDIPPVELPIEPALTPSPTLTPTSDLTAVPVDGS